MKDLFKVRFFVLFVFFSVAFVTAHAQDSTTYYTKELSFKTENDAYLFQLNDAYYTNGFFLNYNWVSKGLNRKKIQGLELSQQIFTPLNRTTQISSEIDRPYCGYLYLKYYQTTFFKRSVLSLNGTVGVIGKSSGGEWMQNWYHDLLRFAKFRGWQYQMPNGVGIDVGLHYAYTVYDKGLFKVIPTVNVNLGMIHTNAKVGANMVFGIFEKNENSALWNARIDRKKTSRNRHNELFVYWHPLWIRQVYNGTLSGTLTSVATKETSAGIEPKMFQQTWGLCYAEGRWTTRFELTYQSKETPSQTKPQRYGGIQLSYRMH